MSKLLTIIALLSNLALYAASNPSETMDQNVLKFLKQAIAPNENYTFDKVVILKKEPLSEISGWMVYFVRIDLHLSKQQGQNVSVNDIIFTNGTLMSKDFNALSNGRSIKGRFSLDMDPKAYNKEHLLAGNFDAPHKIVVFSDPLCPFCMDFVPEVLADVLKHPETFALFYYHFPLTIHPASATLVKAMLLAEEKGDKMIAQKVYKAYLDIEEKDEQKILDIFNNTFQKNFTLEEINKPSIVKRVAEDMALASALMVNGTPTIYFDGKKDDTKHAYKALMKESK
jgi:protein-disulfide isomerase